MTARRPARSICHGMLRTPPGSRKRVLFGALAVACVAAVLAWRAFRISDLLRMGTGYSAQQTCACLFVAARSLPSCLTDLDPLARRITSVRVGAQEVGASAFGLASATARYEKGFGCSLRD